MRPRTSVIITSALITVIGLVTLLGLLVGDDFGGLTTLVTATPIRLIAEVFLRLTTIVIALTVLIGVMNLLLVNISRIRRGRTIGARLGSLTVIISFLAVIFVRVLDSANQTKNLPQVIERVLVPLEASLSGLVFFALVWGAFRLLRRGVTWGRALFLVAMLVVLLGALPLGASGLLNQISTWLLEVPVSAGASGILLGIALATIIAGVRVLIGQDRQYGE